MDMELLAIYGFFALLVAVPLLALGFFASGLVRFFRNKGEDLSKRRRSVIQIIVSSLVLAAYIGFLYYILVVVIGNAVMDGM